MSSREAFKVKGADGRTQVLQSVDLSDAGPGLLGSSYSYADSLPNPVQNGGTTGGSIEDIITQLKNIAYYIDAIGTGGSSNGLTRDMNMQPLGVNYFIPTGQSCANGAQMWEYIHGIPQGNAFGKDLQQAMAQMNMPQLRGLAPGILEDVEAAVDVAPLLGALTGTGYADCMLATYQVGDLKGNIIGSDGSSWISDPNSAFTGANPGVDPDGNRITSDSYGNPLNSNTYYQTKWVQNKNRRGKPVNLDKDTFDSIEKTQNFDGTTKTDTFVGSMTKPYSMVVISILCILAFGFVHRN